MHIRLKPSFYIEDSAGTINSIERALTLLVEVEKHGNLRSAAEAIGISYRSGWEMIAVLEKRLGGPVLEMTRGRGSDLTELGRRLLWAQKLVHARFDPSLDSMAIEIDAQVKLALEEGQDYLKIFASHGYAIAALNAYLQKSNAQVELSYRGSLEALKSLSRKSCDVAGFHVPIGELQQQVQERIRSLLNERHRIITVATRRQGFMVQKGNPKEIWSIADLFKPDVRFVNRQQGSGTRMILELLLERVHRHGTDIHGFEDVELTHAAIAAYIASGKADTGFGVEAAARQFDLDFVPVLVERYFFACDESTMADARFSSVLAYLQGSAFRSELLNHSGYDGSDAGKVAMPTALLADDRSPS